MVEHGESPITSIVQEDDGYTVHIGTGAGDLASLDMRTGEHCTSVATEHLSFFSICSLSLWSSRLKAVCVVCRPISWEF